MLFNSPEFLFCFLPIVLAGYLTVSRFGRTPVVAWLGIISLAFYAYWRPAFVVLLLGSIAVNYICARMIWANRNRPRIQRSFLLFGLAANLGALAYFKYLFPLLHFANGLLSLGLTTSQAVLPLGISFFTFTQIAYLVDLSQDEAEPQDLPSYVLFVTFFPHLIAGPILHHREIMPQFARGRDFSLKWNDFALGLTWFILGLCKKVLIADHLAPYADAAFNHAGSSSLIGAWIGVLNYALQLYFDFSGYSDMAVGLARMLSIELPLNFDSPYKCSSIIDFWSRWHMTLTRYLTLFLYNPLSIWVHRLRAAAGKSNSRKTIRSFQGFSSLVAFPTIITMFLAGIWHGAGLQFLIFGVLHGIYLSVNHAWRIFRSQNSVLTKVVSWQPVGMVLTALAVLMGQIFFRAASTHDALQMLWALCGLGSFGFAMHSELSARAYLVLLLLPVVWYFPNTQELLGQTKSVRENIFGTTQLVYWRPSLAWALASGILFVTVLWYMTNTSAFLYFQF